MNTPLTRMELQCLGCKTWFASPIQWGSKESFERTKMVGNVFGCPNCRAFVPCNKENMRWLQSDGNGGFVGSDTKSTP